MTLTEFKQREKGPVTAKSVKTEKTAEKTSAVETVKTDTTETKTKTRGKKKTTEQ